MKKYRSIIWDWNGTLLDDVDIAIGTVNDILARRGLPPTERERYFRDFEMPVTKYYENAGLDLLKVPFSVIAAEFSEGYGRRVLSAKLAEGAIEVLKAIRDAGIRQTIISSSEQKSLVALVSKFGIERFFDEVIGKGDFLADGKADIALEWLARGSSDARTTLLVGDLVYDTEVAAAIGCDCVLIGHGHQGRDKLAACGTDILYGIADLPRYMGLKNGSDK